MNYDGERFGIDFDSGVMDVNIFFFIQIQTIPRKIIESWFTRVHTEAVVCVQDSFN